MERGKEEDAAAVEAAVRRLARLFALSFPPIGLLALVYVGLGDSVFGPFGFVGRRLPRRARTAMRRCYISLQVVAAAVLHVATFHACFITEDACRERPLVHRRWCMATASASVVAFALALAVDRGMDPMLQGPRHLHAHGTTSRIFNAATVCVAWMCLAELEAMGVVLLLAATARRALAPVPLVAKLYLGLLQLYALRHTFLTLHDPETCHGASRRAPVVAVMACLLAL